MSTSDQPHKNSSADYDSSAVNPDKTQAKSIERVPSRSRGARADVNATVQLCLKLPGGERLEEQFLVTDRITKIVSYAQQYSSVDLSQCELATNEIPRRVISDQKMTLLDAGITVRTLLYFSAC